MKAPLEGKKTYVAAVMAIIGFWAAWSTGDMALADAIQATVTSILAITIRHGVSTTAAKNVAPFMLLPLLLVMGGCQTSPGGYTPDDTEYNYDWAQETYIGTVQNLLIAKQGGTISQEDWDSKIYPLILEGDKILDVMETAALAGDKSTLEVKLVTFRAIYQKLVIWTLTDEQGAIDERTTGPFTFPGSPGRGDLGVSVGRQAARPQPPGASQAGTQALGRTGWRGSVAA